MFRKIKRYLNFFYLGVYALLKKNKSQSVVSKKEMNLNLLDDFNIPNLNDYVIQGICSANEYLLITAYDNSRQNNSKVFIVKDKEVVHETILDTKSHVGGICYDDKNNNIWVTDTKGTISAYKYEDIINKENVTAIYKKIKVVKTHINIYGNTASAFITYYKNRIYVGNYNKKSKSVIICYDVLKDGNIDTERYKIINGLDFIQGICFYSKKDKDYLITSSSFLLKKSIIRIFEYNEDLIDLSKTQNMLCKVSTMAEQIIIKDLNLYIAFESNAKKFKKYHIKNSDIEVYDIQNYI